MSARFYDGTVAKFDCVPTEMNFQIPQRLRMKFPNGVWNKKIKKAPESQFPLNC